MNCVREHGIWEGAMKNMRGNEQLIQLSWLQATGGGVQSLANAKSLEKH